MDRRSLLPNSSKKQTVTTYTMTTTEPIAMDDPTTADDAISRVPTVPVNPPIAQSENSASAEGLPSANVKLVTRNLRFFYGSVQALSDISMSIPVNRVTALIGPSGCGK